MNQNVIFSVIMGREQLSKSDLVALGLDPLFVDVACFAVNKQTYSNLLFQKEFSIDYNHAEKLFRELRDYNIVGSATTTPREIMNHEQLDELLLNLKRKRIGIASKEDLANSYKDEYSVRYTIDGKRLLKAPEDIKNYNVKEGTLVICDKAFANTRLTSVTIVEGTEIIGNSCFQYCQDLISIMLPSSLKEIDECCFSHCTKLTSIYIPKNVEKIGLQIFTGCNCLSSVVVDGNNKYYDSRGNCNAIIESRNNTLYTACSFSKIPEGVKRIGEYSFCCCDEMSSITIPGCVEIIGFHAFYRCENLKKVVFQEGVKDIGHYAFMDVHSLKAITLPNSLKTIGEGAFEGCNIDTLFIPDGVEVIWGNPFKGNNTKHISVSENNMCYDSRNNCNAVIQSQSNVLIIGSCSTVIPSSVMMVGEFAFYGCTGLTSIVIPEGVKRLAHNAFAHCEGYSYLNEHSLFNEFEIEQCEGLTSISIPNSIERAWGFVFGSATNLKILIPKGTKEKFEKIFLDFYKNKLEEQE